MVNPEGQLYTMEGIAAGVIMILTAYMVMGAASVYTPGDTHITDMQLEQVGTDVLKIMDASTNFSAPEGPSPGSVLEQIVATNDGSRFHRLFWETYLMSGEIAAQKTTRSGSSIITNATVYFHYIDGATGESVVKGYQLSRPLIPYSGSEPGVRVTRFVKIPARNQTGTDGTVDGCSCAVACGANCCGPGVTCMPPEMENRPQVVLVEVFMWKA